MKEGNVYGVWHILHDNKVNTFMCVYISTSENFFILRPPNCSKPFDCKEMVGILKRMVNFKGFLVRHTRTFWSHIQIHVSFVTVSVSEDTLNKNISSMAKSLKQLEIDVKNAQKDKNAAPNDRFQEGDGRVPQHRQGQSKT